jgi:hypothetical protein
VTLAGADDWADTAPGIAAELTSALGDRPTRVACTGRFAGLADRPNVLYPSVVLAGLVDAVLPSGGRLGVLVPRGVQVAPFQAQWTTPTREAIAVAANPGSDATVASAALSRAGVDIDERPPAMRAHSAVMSTRR